MRVEDLTVEVRDRDLVRQGQVDAQFLTGALFSPRANGVGVWKLSLPAVVDGVAFEECFDLQQEGAGLIVTAPGGHVVSGLMDTANLVTTTDDPDGVWEFTGVSDDILLLDALAYPSPGVADPGAQTAANDVQTGPVETLLRHYVGANISNGDLWAGTGAPAGRLEGLRTRLRLQDVDQRRGPVRTASPRFQNLLELCQSLVAGTNLLFRIAQVDDVLEFQVYEATDLSADERWDVDNDQLSRTETGKTAAAVTNVVVAGQEQGTDRTIIERTNEAAAEAIARGGRRIETFLDQRQTDELDELRQAGDERLLEGAAGASFVVVPSDDLADAYGESWQVGDTVTVVVGDDEVPARVTSAALSVAVNGVFVAAVVGDDEGDWEGQTSRSLAQVRSRVSNLERNASTVRGRQDILGRHISEAPSTGRAYFGTAATPVGGTGEIYIGMSPQNGLDDAQQSALWVNVVGKGELFSIRKTGHQVAPHAPFAMAAGLASVDTSYPYITLPAGRFTQPPIVTSQLNSGAGADIGVTTMVTGVSATNFRLRHTGPSGSRSVFWQAVQMNPGSASG